MRKILIIGIGAGNPDYVTIQAVEAMNRADVFFVPDKGAEKGALRQLREEICARFIRSPDYRLVPFTPPLRDRENQDYRGGVDDWHAELAKAYEALITAELPEGGCGAFLVWGDPALYDSTLRIIEAIRAGGMALEYDVIPGITAVQALAAEHRIPLNRIGEPVLITTGRRIAEAASHTPGDAVVMLDGEQAFAKLPDADSEIYWGAYLGTEAQVLISGRLGDVADQIARTRAEKRAEHGWIMDTYLLRRR